MHRSALFVVLLGCSFTPGVPPGQSDGAVGSGGDGSSAGGTATFDSVASTMGAASGQSQCWDLNRGVWGGGSTKPGVAMTTMTWTQGPMLDDWALAAISVHGG